MKKTLELKEKLEIALDVTHFNNGTSFLSKNTAAHFALTINNDMGIYFLYSF